MKEGSNRYLGGENGVVTRMDVILCFNAVFYKGGSGIMYVMILRKWCGQM